MLERIKKYIEHHDLLSEHASVIIGISGGADSVALLDILYRLGYTCIPCHCNFHLRGEESLRDESFVCELVSSYGLSLIKKDFDTKEYASGKGISIEMAARELRYAWFEEQKIHHRASAIAVAHHLDDSVETVLLNLTRGTGIRGLTGIRVKNGNVIRPLLPLSKKEILEYLKKNKLPFVTDSTNEESIYTRNFIRNKIVPLFQELNPDFNHTIGETCQHLTETEAIYLQAIEEWKKKICRQEKDSLRISVSALLSSPAPQTILFEILSPFGFNTAVVKDMYEHLGNTSGKIFYPTGFRYKVITHRAYLLLHRNETKEQVTYRIGEQARNISHPVSFTFTVKENTPGFCFRKNHQTAYFDLDKITYPLELRHWKTGDWFIPFGMQGKKKVSDYFSDRKLSLPEKDKAWILTNGKGEILWLVGKRTDNRFRVTKETRHILQIDLLPDKEE